MIDKTFAKQHAKKADATELVPEKMFCGKYLGITARHYTTNMALVTCYGCKKGLKAAGIAYGYGPHTATHYGG